MRSFIICTHPQISLGKENKVSWACGTHGRRKFTWFWWESPKHIDHSEERGADGRMGSEWILGRFSGGTVTVPHAQTDVQLQLVLVLCNAAGCVRIQCILWDGRVGHL
jgi:hypothetical protein